MGYSGTAEVGPGGSEGPVGSSPVRGSRGCISGISWDSSCCCRAAVTDGANEGISWGSTWVLAGAVGSARGSASARALVVDRCTVKGAAKVGWGVGAVSVAEVGRRLFAAGEVSAESSRAASFSG